MRFLDIMPDPESSDELIASLTLVILMVLLQELVLRKSQFPLMTGCFGGWTAWSRAKSFAAGAKRFRRLSPRSSPAWNVAALRGSARSSFRLKSSNWLRKASGKTPQNGQSIEGRCRLGRA